MVVCSQCQSEKREWFTPSQLKKKSAARRCVVCMPPPELDRKDTPDLPALFKWVQKANGRTDTTLTTDEKSGERSLVSNGAKRSGSRVVFVPRTCLIVAEENGHNQLAMKLLTERKLGEQSHYYPYIRNLPQSYRHLPIFQDQHGVEGTVAGDMIKMRRLSLWLEYSALRPPFTYAEFVWARCVVITRVFNCELRRGVFNEALVPIADLMNHDNCPSVHWRFNYDLGGFCMDTVRPVPRGRPFSDSYGHKCNSRYWVNYGFTLPENHKWNQTAFYVEGKGNSDDGYSGYDFLLTQGLGNPHKKRVQLDRKAEVKPEWRAGIVSQLEKIRQLTPRTPDGKAIVQGEIEVLNHLLRKVDAP